MSKLTRRAFLVSGGVVAGGLAIGTGYLASIDTDGLTASIDQHGTVKLNSWVHFRPDGKIMLAIPRVEMGQGVFTSL
ncbi:MAG: xanthine dehydrogenase family protein molybdopterin-binding subunit, partial [Gammaproteobacteria bacterium]